MRCGDDNDFRTRSASGLDAGRGILENDTLRHVFPEPSGRLDVAIRRGFADGNVLCGDEQAR